MNVIKSNDIFPQVFNDDARDVLKHAYTEFVESGGRGSCKSSFISVIIIVLILKNNLANALVLRKVADTLADSVYMQLLWAIDILGVSDEFRASKSPLRIVRKSTGQAIIFRGADKPQKIKSIKLKVGYFAITWFEEVTEFLLSDISTIKISTMRGGDKFWVFYSYNPPSSVRSWCNVEFKAKKSGRKTHHTDYRAVPKEWLGEAFLQEAEDMKKRNPRAYENIFLGLPTGTGVNIFDNIVLREIRDEEIDGFEFVYSGIDWGYYPDPFAYIKMSYDGAKRVLYIFDELYLLKHGNKQASEALREYLEEKAKDKSGRLRFNPMSDRITADSAEPKSIADFRDYGWNIRGAIKGEHSLEAGFKWLQGLKAIVIDSSRCPHAADEFSLYEHERDKKTGEVLSGYPQGQADHGMAAVRYALEEVWRKRGA